MRRQIMKKIIRTVLAAVLVFVPLLSFAATTEDNLQAAKNQTEDALKELKTVKGTGTNQNSDPALYREKGSAYSEYKTSGLGPDYYAKTAESPYTKSKIAQGIAALATTAAAAIGTSMQASVISQLTAMISDLKGSGVPEYQAMAADLQKEVGYIQTGDSISAKNTAVNITTYASTYLPVDTSYIPTASEKAALNPFVEFFKGFISSVLSVLSSSAIQILTTALGAIFGPFGAAIGGSLGAVVNSLAQSLIYNTPVDPSNLGSTAAGDVNSLISKNASSASSAIRTSATPAANGSSNNPISGPTQTNGDANAGSTTFQQNSTDTKAVNTK
jgi:hypothetical protein